MTRIALTPQSEDREVIEAVVPYLRDKFALSALAAAPTAPDPLFWSHIAELGWTTAALDESQGGTGMDVVQEMLMNREYGRALAPVSVLSTALGLRLLAQRGRKPPEALINGSERIGFAAFTEAGRTGPTLEGEVHLIDPGAQQFLLVDGHGAALFSRAAVSGLAPTESLDPTVGLARATLRGATAWYVSSAEGALPLRSQLLISAQLTGIALAASQMAADYAKVRVQFGKPIGAFQAVAHLCVDAAVRARASDAQVAVAAIATRDGWADMALQVTAATVLASSAALLAATNNIQVHGGMGYSAESGAHLYLKRSVLLKRLLPGSDEAIAVLLQPGRET